MAGASPGVAGTIRRRRGLERSGDKFCHRFIGRTVHSGKHRNTGGGQCPLGTRADSSANDGIHTLADKPKPQQLVSLSITGNDIAALYLTVSDFINLKCLGLAEMLED